MLVYVINKNGNPLMPCKPSKARKLLRDKKAKIVNYAPFTIQLQQILSLDQEREQLLANYGVEEILFYSSIIQESDSYLADEVVTPCVRIDVVP